MNGPLLALVVGFALGVVVVVGIRPRIVGWVAQNRFQRWAATDTRRAVQHGVDRGRAGIKQQLGLDLSARLTTLPFEAADIRFLGHPAHFVVFDGHTEVKDRQSPQLAEVVFVTVRPSAWAELEGSLADADLIEECLVAGRVRWATVRPDTETAHTDRVTLAPPSAEATDSDSSRPAGRKFDVGPIAPPSHRM